MNNLHTWKNLALRKCRKDNRNLVVVLKINHISKPLGTSLDILSHCLMSYMTVSVSMPLWQDIK